MALKEHYDICLVGIPTVINFGGALTYFALYKTLEDLGYSTLMVDHPRSAKAQIRDMKAIYDESPYPDYSIAPRYMNKKHMRELNAKADIFMVGSDQLFNFYLYNKYDQWITLDWVQDNKMKIAYAASFGHDYIWGDDNTRAKMSFFMKKFDYFGVREESAVTLCKEQFGIEATYVLDPVFLCDKRNFWDIAGERINIQCQYISAYLLDINDEYYKILNFVSDKLNMPSEIYSDMPFDVKKFSQKKNSINSRMNSLVYSNFIVTDSFHGTCFAIIMHKNFVTIKNNKRGATRFESILGKFGLLNRMVTNLEEVKEKQYLFENINWEPVDKILAKEIRNSLGWLNHAINSFHKKSFSDYDIILNEMNSIEHRLNILTNENKTLKKSNMALLEACGFGSMMKEINIVNYLTMLRNCNNYIFIAVKDTPGHALNEEIDKGLAELGFTIKLQDKHWHSFIGVISNKKVLFEKISENYEDLNFMAEYEGHAINIESSSFQARNIALINIDGINYSMNRRGLNFVIWNAEKDLVVDNVVFDTHVRGIPCIR